METIVINGTPRTELGKKATRALRKAGNVPCNLYGGKDTVNFYASATDFRKLIYTPDFRLAEININGSTRKAILKEAQYHPVKDELLHVDFQELTDNVKVKVNVPLKLKGTAKGVTEGGKLEQVIRRLTILALPKDLPSVIEVDITDMGLGAIKRIRDIQGYEGVSYLLSDANPIARVMIPRAVKEEAASASAAPAGAPAAAAAKADDKKK